MIGQTISHYQILEKLGEGGMGVVYKAKDLKLERLVALKFLLPHLVKSDEEKQRFIREAQAASALDHANIGTIHEVDEIEDGRMFIAMAYYEGDTLGKRIDQGPLPLNDAVETAVQIAQGLARAHEAGIVHRDVKPANIMITGRGEVKIVDFGLAKLAGAAKLTKSGTTVGTMGYLSPEQARGEEVDYRADIWSLGVVLYEMLSGVLPFKSDYPEAAVYSILNEEQQPLTGLRTGIPMELERIVNKAMAKQAGERYQHLDDMIVDLKRLSNTGKQDMVRGGKSATVSQKKLRWVLPTVLIAVAAPVASYFIFQPRAESKEKIPVAVADFVNETDEKELNGLSGMLVTSLEQSQRLSVLTRSRMFDILKQMGKENVDRIDESLGREICKQAGVNSFVLASIRKFGRLYTIDMKILDLQTNAYRLTAKEESEGQESIPSMLDKLSEKLRVGLNEKVSDVEARNQKLAEITTVNLEAYNHYFLGEQFINKTKFSEAKREFRTAISLDSTFGLAYYRLAYASDWEQNKEQAKKAIAKAIVFIDRIPEKERYLVRAVDTHLERGYGPAIAILKEMGKSFPNDKERLYNIGDWSYHSGNSDSAVVYLQRVLAMDSTDYRAFEHLTWAYEELKEYDNMLKYAKAYVESRKRDPAGYNFLGNAYGNLKDYEHAVVSYQKAIELGSSRLAPYTNLGRIYEDQRQFDKALFCYKQAIEKNSSDAEAYALIGGFYKRRGEDDAALSMYQKAIEIDPTNSEFRYFNAVRLAAKSNSVEKAKHIFDLLLKGNPDDNFLYQEISWFYQRVGDYGKAEDILKDRVDHSPASGEAHVSLAYFYGGLGDISSQLQYFLKAIKVDSTTRFAYSGLAQIYLRRKSYNDAIALLKKAIDHNQHDVWNHIQLVNTYREMGDDVQARQVLEDWRSLAAPDSSSTYSQGASPYIDLADLFFALNEPDSALFYYEKAVAKDGRYNYDLGYFFRYRNMRDKAVESYKEALQFDSSAYRYADLGDCYMSFKEYRKAEEAYNKAIARNLSDSYIYESLSKSYRKQHNRSKELNCLNRVAELSPSGYYRFLKFGDYYKELGEYQKAKAEYGKARQIREKVVRLYPNGASAYGDIGRIELRLNRYESAITLFKKSIQLDPSAAESYYGLAAACALQNSRMQALEWFERALKAGYLWGYQSIDNVENDPDLDNIKETVKFKELLNKYGELARRKKSYSRYG